MLATILLNTIYGNNIYVDELYSILLKAEHQEENLGTGTFSMFTDKFVFKTIQDGKENIIELLHQDIVDISMYGKQGLVFSDNQGNYYDLTSDKVRNVRKFIFCFKYLK